MTFRRSLGWKFSLVQLVTIALFAISAIVVNEGLGLVNKGVQQQQQNEARLLDMAELMSRAQSKQIALNDYATSKETKYIDQFQALSEQIDATLRTLEPAMRTNEQKRLLEQAMKQHQAYNSLALQSVVPAVQGASGANPAVFNAASSAHKELVGTLGQMLEGEKAASSNSVKQIDGQLKGNTLVLLFSIVI
jgi:CHASE3 domain sensor protein